LWHSARADEEVRAVDDKDRRAVRAAVLEAVETTLEAQLRAVRRLRSPTANIPRKGRDKGMSHVEYVEDILRRAGRDLHISDIIARVKEVHAVGLERESLVSALTKKVQQGKRFVRTGPNVFGLKPAGR
jgi:hypothetical protein